jgi:CBS domain-containing protein
MSVGRICSRDVDLIGFEDSVAVAAQRMHSHKVGTLMVADGDNRPIGMITDRDLVVRVIAAGLDHATTDVGTVMTRDVTTVYEDCQVETALEVMRRGPFRRLAVVDEDERLVGLLSIDDILGLLTKEFRSIGSLMLAESPQSLGVD